MSTVVPAILTSSRDDLLGKLSALEGLVQDVQIDVVDGTYAAPATWPYSAGSGELAELSAGDGLLGLGDFRYELDLMVANPEEVAGVWVSLGAQRIIVHVESTQFLPQILSQMEREYGHAKGFAPDLLSIGLALKPGTDLSLVDQYAEQIDFVQFMGIEKVGRQGEPFQESVLGKVAELRKRHPDLGVQVDGGVTLENAPKLFAAGAERLTVGSSIWKAPDIAARIREFNRIAQAYGRYS